MADSDAKDVLARCRGGDPSNTSPTMLLQIGAEAASYLRQKHQCWLSLLSISSNRTIVLDPSVSKNRKRP
jgi:hypothetical protein